MSMKIERSTLDQVKCSWFPFTNSFIFPIWPDRLKKDLQRTRLNWKRRRSVAYPDLCVAKLLRNNGQVDYDFDQRMMELKEEEEKQKEYRKNLKRKRKPEPEPEEMVMEISSSRDQDH